MSGHAVSGAAADVMGLMVILSTLVLLLVIVAGFLLWALISGVGVLYAVSRLPVFFYQLYRGEPWRRAARQAASKGTAALGYIGIVTSLYLGFIALFGQFTAVVVRTQVEMAERAGETSRFAEALEPPPGPEQLAITMGLIFGPAVVGVVLLFIADQLDPSDPEESAGLEDTLVAEPRGDSA